MKQGSLWSKLQTVCTVQIQYAQRSSHTMKPLPRLQAAANVSNELVSLARRLHTRVFVLKTKVYNSFGILQPHKSGRPVQDVRTWSSSRLVAIISRKFGKSEIV